MSGISPIRGTAGTAGETISGTRNLSTAAPALPSSFPASPPSRCSIACSRCCRSLRMNSPSAPRKARWRFSLSTGFLAICHCLCCRRLGRDLGRRSLMFGLAGWALAVLTIARGLLPELASCCWSSARSRAFSLAAFPPSPWPIWRKRSIRRGLGATMGLYVGGTAFGGMSGRVLTGILCGIF